MRGLCVLCHPQNVMEDPQQSLLLQFHSFHSLLEFSFAYLFSCAHLGIKSVDGSNTRLSHYLPQIPWAFGALMSQPR